MILDPRRQAFSLLEEFKAFAFKGNVVDMAVGVVIGGAFGKIIESLVKSVLMPLIAVVMPGEQGYKDWNLVLNGKSIPYGEFLADLVNFLIVAFALFIVMVKLLGMFRTKTESAPPPPTKEEVLLAEIRDLLAKKAN